MELVEPFFSFCSMAKLVTENLHQQMDSKGKANDMERSGMTRMQRLELVTGQP